ncbi:MAG: hypothetical protein PHC28_04230 [Flavobacterium sp.]|uniref:hypothetical protein n=1 Tax=Flavobacterium sp. TaxID=239 RepID=UPI00260AD4CB|nr:hypothetical protein [Flavobacterium sp.]MDD5149671.1 hypothetical protein [Flavobacterium sp.]
MKTIANRLIFLSIYLLGVAIAFGAPSPPSPGAKRPPPPPGLPIDENLYIVFIIALLFGIYIIYKYQLKIKKPI